MSSQGPQKRKSEQCQGTRLADHSSDLSDCWAGPHIKEMSPFLETGKTGTGSPLEPPEGAQLL